MKDRNPDKAQSKQEGFSLIEVMVALTFLAIGLLGVAQMIPAGLAGVTQARVRTNAVQAAQAKIDELRITDYENVVAGNYSETVDNYTLDWTVTTDDPIPGMKRVDLTASWQNPAGTQAVAVNTYLTEGQ